MVDGALLLMSGHYMWGPVRTERIGELRKPRAVDSKRLLTCFTPLVIFVFRVTCVAVVVFVSARSLVTFDEMPDREMRVSVFDRCSADLCLSV